MEKLVDLFTHHAVLPEFWMWVIFGVAVLVLLLWDLLFFNRKNEVPNFMHTLVVCIVYILAACVFGVFVMYEEGFDKGMLFFTGFLVEKSLSLDNVFIMSLIFTTLGVPRMYQHRVLFWGILGAIVMRAVLILVGDALIRQFHWVLYIFSEFLLYTGVKIILPSKEEAKSLKDSRLYKLVSKMFHVTHEIHGAHFFIKKGGHHYITPLFFALIIIETMDVIFALDSIPAIFLITQDVFIIYTSNIFAILGLRALYFLLEAAVNKFVYLKQALSVVLIFIGLKIFLPYFGIELQPVHSLAITFSILFAGMFFSIVKLRRNPNA